MLARSSSRAICRHLSQVSVESAFRSVSSTCLRRVLCRNMSTNDDFPSRRRRDSRDPSDSIFSSEGPTWDHVFSDIKEMPPQIPGVGPRRPRRQTMTAQEINAFNEIFDLIFDSMSEKGSGPSRPVNTSGTGLGDMFSTLRRHSKRMKWTAQSDEELDSKKEAMDRCETDQQLLNWAMREVFGESQSYQQEFKQANATITELIKANELIKAKEVELPMMQPPTYPHLISLLIRTFRDKYLASYVFGCSTSAYNELIATRWTCFRDLKGVHDALEEMTVNGVDMDNKTRELVEKVRQEVGERNLWMEENEIERNGGVWEMLNNIERLVNLTVVSRARNPRQTTRKESMSWNDWRSEELAKTMEWEFDKW
ncbi:hypothetical protein B0H17DRAFT_1064301 [Mycena rosella]|uniref:Mtf2-like C-terminal domain-containing protein n=1 Tax=Mycena rosella TaxID=1033263 RepID=A0AAD7GE52_MYCRO|nr:hypothetical protein B0H17DRAFT_1064301 [Mycena rosella]